MEITENPICLRVQLIPNCFSNRSISYTNCTPLGPITMSYHFQSVREQWMLKSDCRIKTDSLYGNVLELLYGDCIVRLSGC